MIIGGRRPIPAELKAEMTAHKFFNRGYGFKFHHTDISDAIYRTGSIRIRRLRDFGTMEKSSLNDVSEGLEQAWSGSDSISVADIHPTNVAHRTIGGTGTITNVFVGVEQPDVYAYCFSWECTAEVLQSFDDNRPFDAVAHCTDLHAVARIVCAEHPTLRGSSYWCLPVVYRNRLRGFGEASASSEANPFEKDSRFTPNEEGRIVFVPPQPIREHVEIWRSSKLAALFRPYPMPQ